MIDKGYKSGIAISFKGINNFKELEDKIYEMWEVLFSFMLKKGICIDKKDTKVEIENNQLRLIYETTDEEKGLISDR
jgi:hypothetical protein